jgi:hypothetical protein
MAQQSDANSIQPPSPLVPRQDVQSNEPSRPQPQRSSANTEGVGIELRKLRFYNEDAESPLYSARAMPYTSNHEQIGEGAHAKVYKSTIKGGFYNAGQGPISTVSKFVEMRCSYLTRFAGLSSCTKRILGNTGEGQLPD